MVTSREGTVLGEGSREVAPICRARSGWDIFRESWNKKYRGIITQVVIFVPINAVTMEYFTYK